MSTGANRLGTNQESSRCRSSSPLVHHIRHHHFTVPRLFLPLLDRRLPTAKLANAVDCFEIPPLASWPVTSTSIRLTPSIPLLPRQRLPRCCSRTIHLPTSRPGSGQSLCPPSIRQRCRASLYPSEGYFDQSMERTRRTRRPTSST
jgi:hypothetical protein